MNADELDAAREAVAASRAWRDQMRADWGHHREPEEILDEAVGELTAERDRLRKALDAAISYAFALEGQKEAVVVRARRNYEAALAALELDDPETTDG